MASSESATLNNKKVFSVEKKGEANIKSAHSTSKSKKVIEGANRMGESSVARVSKNDVGVTTAVIKLKQLNSGAGKIKKQIQTLKGLGLNKINKIVELNDTPAIRGMINKVRHLVEIVN